jgi:hypothetical protein
MKTLIKKIFYNDKKEKGNPIPAKLRNVAKSIVKFLKNDVTISEKTKGSALGFIME